MLELKLVFLLTMITTDIHVLFFNVTAIFISSYYFLPLQIRAHMPKYGQFIVGQYLLIHFFLYLHSVPVIGSKLRGFVPRDCVGITIYCFFVDFTPPSHSRSFPSVSVFYLATLHSSHYAASSEGWDQFCSHTLAGCLMPTSTTRASSTVLPR